MVKNKQRSTKHTHKTKDRVTRTPVKNKQRSTKHTHKTKDRVTRTPVNNEGELIDEGYTAIYDVKKRTGHKCVSRVWRIVTILFIAQQKLHFHLMLR
jgi:hypothetical protein